MSEENISLFELLNLSIGTPQRGSVNFSALYALLLAVLEQLGALEMKTRWREPPPGHTVPDALVDVTARAREQEEEEEEEEQEEEEEVRPDTESDQQVQQRREASGSGSGPDAQGRLRSRIQTCEDGVSKAMQLLKELMEQKEALKQKMEELQQQRKPAETPAAEDQCCHRVEALEEAVSCLRETLQKYPDPEELSQCVTWDFVQSVLNDSTPPKKPGNSNDSDPAMPVEPTYEPPTGPPRTPPPLADEYGAAPAAPRSPNLSAQILNPLEADDSVPPGSPSQIQGQPPGIQDPQIQHDTPGTPEPQIQGQPSRIQDPQIQHDTPGTPEPQIGGDSPRTQDPQMKGDPLKTPEPWIGSDSLRTQDPKRKTPGPVAAHLNVSQKVGGSAWYQETVEAVRNINNLKEKFSRLEARMAALEEQKVDQNQLAQLRELITNKGSRDAWSSLMDQLSQQKALIESLMSDREKLDNLEDMLMDLMSQDRGNSSEAASESPDADSRRFHELRQQVSYLRKSLHKLEEDVKHLRSKQVLMEERAADQNLQDQLDELRGTLEDMMLSLMSQLSSSVQDEAEQDESESQGVSESAERSALTFRTVNVGRKLSLLFQHYEQLQDMVNALIQQQSGDRTGPLEDRQASRNVALVNDVQKAILQLQADCEKLQETSRSLHEDNRLKQRHIEELYKTTEELEVKKADKQMVESEIKADKSALENKVSRLQFDSATEQLNSMFHELLNKVTGQEQDWHQVVDRLSTEMECKLNRMELDSVKKQLEDRWKSIHRKLQAQSAPEHEDAAGIRKQLVERFHCLSCDRPILKQTPGPMLVTLPSFPAFPSRKSTKPYSLEQLRQQSRSLKPGTNRYNLWMANEARKRAELRKSHANMCRQIESVELQRRLKNKQNPAGVQHERISEPADYLVVPRSCGGSHTNTSSGQRRSGLQHTKLHAQSEADDVSQEFDIIGLDGRIYKGRLNGQAMKNTETKLPIIPSKDGMFKTKDKVRSSASQRPAASPEVGHNTPIHTPSAKSNSRPASSCSGRDWPVSALGCCTSQSSVSQASAAAESGSDPQSDDPMNP
ncbi:glutamine-rich protein 2 isoform X2 [Kryptolebias marmoratus]|uniref:glutamine-rich protein 2 isoform X2 n=1 Tax=Kryptolebias marmoratus TaxID=37003 RepID=UPI0018ACDA9A|nr:glutamine-rich protein 2 isoform X2 [Kryptolebias marmoratus]